MCNAVSYEWLFDLILVLCIVFYQVFWFHTKFSLNNSVSRSEFCEHPLIYGVVSKIPIRFLSNFCMQIEFIRSVYKIYSLLDCFSIKFETFLLGLSLGVLGLFVQVFVFSSFLINQINFDSFHLDATKDFWTKYKTNPVKMKLLVVVVFVMVLSMAGNLDIQTNEFGYFLNLILLLISAATPENR